MPLLYGTAFDDSLVPYIVLIGAQAAFFFTHVNYMLLYGRGRATTAWACTLCGLVVNVAVNLALIPPFGATGAAVAAVISELAVLGVQACVIRAMLRSSRTDVAEPVRPEFERAAA